MRAGRGREYLVMGSIVMRCGSAECGARVIDGGRRVADYGQSARRRHRSVSSDNRQRVSDHVGPPPGLRGGRNPRANIREPVEVMVRSTSPGSWFKSGSLEARWESERHFFITRLSCGGIDCRTDGYRAADGLWIDASQCHVPVRSSCARAMSLV